MTLSQFLYEAKTQFSSLETRDIEIIFSEISGFSTVEMITQSQKNLPENIQKKIINALQKRFEGHSISEIFRKKYFYNLEFFVTNDVLTPRPETEFLVDFALEKLSQYSQISTVIDVGTGSGCIVSALAKNAPAEFSGKFLASDISQKALDIAKKNAENLLGKNQKKIEFRKSSLFSEYTNSEISRSIILANLPYIPQKDSSWMDKEVVNGDPHLALFSGEDGLDLYREFFVQLQKFPDFFAVCFEYDPPQTDFFQKFLPKIFPEKNISFHSDLSGEVRFGVIENPEIL